ncbi:T9SS type A sorting domain-containing protein [Gramella sp. MAR_2010_147]|uniref:T9SS type A sorting domain-containing protein n=1 Tax=Gramella sp. MAR_2010_147 TaxID=1250205 RepID=UPI00087D4C15|nr:T9SS type A sorting domain-containing protein [Gramella sp. MAR_2010_147]SDS27334.1 Por secretion system C-terminal sorting domain-containing protein [Gramella sp. MAR_2010_147]
MKKLLLLFSLSFIFHLNSSAQINEIAGPAFIDSASVVKAGPLSKARLIRPQEKAKLYNPRNRGINKVVPGKGLPKTIDPALQSKMGDIPVKAPIFSFDGAVSRSTPSDPTGAVGKNHYVNAWNSAFAIWDKEGNQLVPPSALESIGGAFSNENDGDPIVFYDESADRFILMQFSAEAGNGSSSPAALLFAVSQGPDPINSGWYTYRFNMESLPDYPKISLWNDGYYITTNKNALAPQGREIVYVLERDRMLQGLDNVRILGFPLPGIQNNGFYSPAGFSVMGTDLPPPGNAPIIYLQDDDWAGVNQDHLKLWLINVNWNNIASSTIEESQELTNGVSPFTATFDGGGFQNLAQPGDTPDIDALQGAMMYMTQYRRFGTHNSVVMNFVVDVEPSAAKHAGIRWYELRQPNDDAPWSVYQEGTYAPDNSDRFSGSIGIDLRGNIAMGYTVLNDNPANPVFPSIRYTGRFVNDQLGVMTIQEESIVEGNSPQPRPEGRYGDYAHLSIDPVDDLTFWHNAEYFEGVDRVNKVGVFRIAANEPNDLGAVALLSPQNATLTNSEAVTIRIRNYGTNAQSNFEVSYSINGGTVVTETYEETIPAESSAEFTFEVTGDFSEIGEIYTVTIATNLENDSNTNNDAIEVEIKNLPPNDVGVTSIDSPFTDENLTSTEEVTVTISNLGGEPQQNFPVSYQIGNNAPVLETYSQVLSVGEDAVYTFNRTANLSGFGRYMIEARTRLEDDFDPSNDAETISVANLDCIPEGSDCSQGDGIFYFELGEYRNERIPCTNGYIDFIGGTTDLDRSQGDFTVTVQTGFAEGEREKFSMWIDFNDNAVFEDDERLITSEVIPQANRQFSYDFSIPRDADLGQHLLRIRAGDTDFAGDLNDPCSVMAYGTTHDYSVNVTDSTLDIEDFILNEAELVVVTLPNQDNQFRAIMETSFHEPLRITVHNVLGQKMIENEVRNDGDAYVYELDMSYAARGVYLVRFGTRKVGKVARFIVK